MRIIYTFLFTASFLISFAQISKNAGALNLEWKSRGLSNVSGTTPAILWDKNDQNILYAGGIGSGLYQSKDKGLNWESVRSYYGNNPNINDIDQSTTGSIFVSTGSFGAGVSSGLLHTFGRSGNGIYRSQDEGETWVHLNNSAPGLNGFGSLSTTKLSSHPTDNNIILVGTTGGIYLSSNAEFPQPTFSYISGLNGNVTDIKITSDGSTAWAAVGGRLYKSESTQDNFATGWNQNSPTNGSRAQIALSGIDNNGNYTVYCSFASNSGCFIGLYKSEDNGNTWQQIDQTSSLDPFLSSGSTCLGWYTHTLEVNPQNRDILYLGGVSLFTFTVQESLIQIDDINNENASDYITRNKHTIVFNPSNSTEAMIGTDNGIYFSDNSISGHPYNTVFSKRSNGLNTGMVLNADIGKNGEILVNVNETNYYNDYNNSSPYFYNEIIQFSNLTTEISNFTPNNMLFSESFGRLKKSTDNGQSYFSPLDNNIDPANCGFITCTSNSICDAVYASNYFQENYLFETASSAKYFVPTNCGSKFFMSENILNNTNNIEYFVFTLPLVSGIRDISFSADGDKMVYASGSRVGITSGWNSFSSSTPENDSINNLQINFDTINLNSIGINNISSISIDMNNENHFIITEDGLGSNTKVAKTTDGGATWTIIHNNLPEIPIYDCIIDANNSNNYILATEQGIWSSNDAGQTWTEDSEGIPGKLPFFRLRQEWVLEEDCYVLLASGFGSGIFTCTTLTSCNKNVEEEIWGVYNSIEIKNSDNSSLNVYPNPTNALVTISSERQTNEEKAIKIFDILGREVYSSFFKKTTVIDTQNWKAGTYFIATENHYSKLLVK